MDLSEVPSHEFLRHPWELARGQFFLSELGRAGLLTEGTRILDVGAGDAWFAKKVAAVGPELTCWDLGYDRATPPPADRVSYTATKPEGKFDGILLLDVAEHVPNDRSFMSEVLSCARPGAMVVFSVPAWPALYSKHDEALRHYRRYRPKEGRALLQGCELVIERSGGLFHSLLAPRVATRLLERREKGRTFDENAPAVPEDLAWHGGKLLRSAILGALSVDRWATWGAAAVGLELPGLSWWAVARVPDKGDA